MKFSVALEDKGEQGESVDCFLVFCSIFFMGQPPRDCELLKDGDHAASAVRCLKGVLSKCLFKGHENIHPIFSEHSLWTGLVSAVATATRKSLPTKELIGTMYQN